MSCVYDSSATMNNCVVVENSVGRGGGGLMCWGNSSLTMTNCEIMNNTARWGGGVMCDGDAASATLSNCTVWGNSAHGHGGGIVGWKGSAMFINSIMWGNDAPNGPDIKLALGGTLSLTYCNVPGGRSVSGRACLTG